MLMIARADSFTQPENIAVKDWGCQKCGKISQEANKRLSIKRLPPVLSIQFKVGFPSYVKGFGNRFANDASEGSALNNVGQRRTKLTPPCVCPCQ